jgi:hypothetical protein
LLYTNTSAEKNHARCINGGIEENRRKTNEGVEEKRSQHMDDREVEELAVVVELSLEKMLRVRLSGCTLMEKIFTMMILEPMYICSTSRSI